MKQNQQKKLEMFHIFKEEYHGRKNQNYEGKDEKKIKKFIKEKCYINI